jgi:hypothetical protein
MMIRPFEERVGDILLLLCMAVLAAIAYWYPYHNDTNLCFLGKELAAKERKLHKEKKLCFSVLGVVYGSPLWLRRKPRCGTCVPIAPHRMIGMDLL